MKKIKTAIECGFVLEQIYYFADDVEIFTLIDPSEIEDDIEITKKQWNYIKRNFDSKTEVVENNVCITVTYYFKEKMEIQTKQQFKLNKRNYDSNGIKLPKSVYETLYTIESIENQTVVVSWQSNNKYDRGTKYISYFLDDVRRYFDEGTWILNKEK